MVVFNTSLIQVACCILLQILKCISQLELAQLIGTGVKARYITGPSGHTTSGHPIEAFDPEGTSPYGEKS